MASHNALDIEVATDGHVSDVADVEDPHVIALEDNPVHAERVSWSTTLAVLVYSPRKSFLVQIHKVTVGSSSPFLLPAPSELALPL